MAVATDSPTDSTEPAAARKTGRPRGSRTLRGLARPVAMEQALAYLRAVGRRIEDARLERGISAYTLAAAIGTSPSGILRIERGHYYGRKIADSRCGPHLVTIIRIAIALDVALYELMP